MVGVVERRYVWTSSASESVRCRGKNSAGKMAGVHPLDIVEGIRSYVRPDLAAGRT